ncbi:serine hydrolase domain-containing protein [Hydrogenophaga sp. UC242_50]|jgi:CubicO group peptidase (beta-lactamase class C family)|uniref:serine hydrolase domain-containing protein n=1 Tax=unclassified Hydrogenophaga TaxID=2610897 RepID=UPI0036D27CF7
MTSLPAVTACLAFTLACVAHAAAPDDALLRGGQGYPPGGPVPLASHLVADEQPQHLLNSFSGALEQALAHRIVRKGAHSRPLARAPEETAFVYQHDGLRLGVNDYLDRQRVTGLMVIKDDTVVLERYQYGLGPATRFLSASMVKSIVGVLIGIALEEGRIRSLDDLARVYVPALAGNPYGETSIRDLLQMSSGVRFSEQYDGRDDLGALIEDTIGRRSPGGAAVLLPHVQRRIAPGQLFYYSSADTQALGLVLRGATGVAPADYLSERIWQPMGAQDDASFLVDAAGQEAAFAFLHATLRDYGRLGMLLANEGQVGDRQVVPAAWVRQSTAVAQPHAQPFVASSYFGYGNHVWIFPGARPRFALIGVRGQVIFVDPALRLVLVQTAVWKSAGDRAARAELLALWRGVVEQYGAW